MTITAFDRQINDIAKRRLIRGYQAEIEIRLGDVENLTRAQINEKAQNIESNLQIMEIRRRGLQPTLKKEPTTLASVNMALETCEVCASNTHKTQNKNIF